MNSLEFKIKPIFDEELKILFNIVDQSESDSAIKKAALSTIYEFIYKSAFVMDQEINAYACLIDVDTMIN